MKGVAILGVTGSIGRSALAVLDQHRDSFRPVVLSAHRNVDALRAAVERWRPEMAVISSGEGPEGMVDGVQWRTGAEALVEAVSRPDVDIVLNAVVGAIGLEPTLAALKLGKRVALANKESLVCGGPLVIEAARAGGGELIPVDSEHSAVLQCLQGVPVESVTRIVLTASGGPFRQTDGETLARMRPADALRHPTWEMGAKITIDSATLANKALEVIEAHFLFGIGYDRIAAVVHPQSIIHSMVEFIDGSVLAQLGFPTMELPILYALAYPERLPYQGRRFDPLTAGTLTFEAVREEDFPAFRLGVAAGRAGGAYPAVFNAANEVAVEAFLEHRLGFTSIGDAIASTLEGWGGGPIDDVASVVEADRWAREATRTYIKRHASC